MQNAPPGYMQARFFFRALYKYLNLFNALYMIWHSSLPAAIKLLGATLLLSGCRRSLILRPNFNIDYEVPLLMSANVGLLLLNSGAMSDEWKVITFLSVIVGAMDLTSQSDGLFDDANRIA